MPRKPTPFRLAAALALAAAAACGAPEPILDGGRCLAHVEALVKIGPRPSGSPGIEKARDYIVAQLQAAGLKPVVDRFPAETKRGPIEMANVRAEIPGASKHVVALVAHYDTKRIPGVTFVGANDGGSSVGVLIEIAKHLAKSAPPITVRLVFVDGEETQGRHEWDDADALYGSRAEVARLKRAGELASTKAVIVLDMIGDKDLDVTREAHATARLVEWVRAAAAEAGASDKFFQTSMSTVDDHIPFVEAGVPEVIDLIDFNFGPNNSWWHKPDDTLDKISAESLRIAGDVTLRTLPKIAKAFPTTDR